MLGMPGLRRRWRWVSDYVVFSRLWPFWGHGGGLWILFGDSWPLEPSHSIEITPAVFILILRRLFPGLVWRSSGIPVAQ